MKIETTHYDYMYGAISQLDIEALKASIEDSAKQPKDFNKRLRWDAMYAAGLSAWVCDNLYSYMDDTHIDTALKDIMRKLA